MRIPVLYEDNHLLIVEKPVNIPTQEDRSGDKDLLTLLKEDIKTRYGKPGNVFLGMVHRLDRPVGGVIVFAKTSKAASRLSDALRKGAFDRSYIAVTRGAPPKDKGVLKHFLQKNHWKNIVKAVSKDAKNAKHAILEYETLRKTKEFSLLSIKLHTGRSHQIRVQLSASGFPIFGDQKYGKNMNKPGQQLALWSHMVKFEHPTKKDIVEIVSPLPNQYPWNIFQQKYS